MRTRQPPRRKICDMDALSSEYYRHLELEGQRLLLTCGITSREEVARLLERYRVRHPPIPSWHVLWAERNSADQEDN